MKKAFSLSCLHPNHQKMANNPIYGIQTIQNEFHCSNSNEDYVRIGSDIYEDFHQRCSSKSSGTSSADTYTLKVRMESLEMALTMLRANFQRMEKTLNKQIEKAIDFITNTEKQENEPDLLSEKTEKCFMRSENSKLVKTVELLTESSQIMRSALAEHSKVINRLVDAVEQPLESVKTPNEKRIESPIERKINRWNQDTIRVLCPKPVNPLNISEYLAVENDAPASNVVPPPCYCGNKKLQNISNELWDNSAETNITKANSIQETSITTYNLDVDTEGEYVTLIQNYIAQCNDAYQWYDKPRTDELHCETSSVPFISLDECKGTLV